MADFDLTVALTAHNETVVAGPTMASAERAIHAAERAGFRVERLLGLDAPSRQCRAFFAQPEFSGWNVHEYDFQDPYPVRNALAALATGRWIAFLDADDLFSENWLAVAAQMLREAEEKGRKIVVHPEVNWIFDGVNFVYSNPAQRGALFLPEYFYCSNYYDMLCAAPRSAFVDIQYARRDLENGFGFADWQWSIEAAMAGWEHEVASDTIIFKRRRDWSVVVENYAKKTIIHNVDGMAIDDIRTRWRLPANATE